MRSRDTRVLRAPMPARTSPDRIGNFIEGEWRFRSSGAEHNVVNPASGETFDSFIAASTTEVEQAADAAMRAFPRWAQTPAIERAKILAVAAGLMRDRAESIALNLTLEQGKPLAQARDEVLSSADVMTWFAEQAERAYGRRSRPVIPP